MALMDFIKKQFIDILEWTEGRRRHAGLALSDGGHGNPVNGGTLVVRESQMAVFVNEGQGRRLAPAPIRLDHKPCRCSPT